MLIGVFGGFYIVPLYALIQSARERSAPVAHHRRQQHPQRVVHGGRGADGDRAAQGAGCTIPQLFLVTALLNAVVAIYIYTLVPEFLMRFLVWLLMHTMYRLDEERPGTTFRRKARRCSCATT